MATIFRLQRGGRKNRSYFRIMVADSAQKRDGRFLEEVGSYDPLTTPATIQLKEAAILEWMSKGAVPSDTVKSIFRRHGLLVKHQAVMEGKDPASVGTTVIPEKAKKPVPSKKAQAKAAAGAG
ncbi:MAG TPA: 30S ribosomal protein S16 [Fibrobacteria bacterium]|nr:30S ribosomal protein S16 [Fibrobacteria bacterium]HOX51518.1 30S ribosomal protein S16 [Fibrobacteria bacterium]